MKRSITVLLLGFLALLIIPILVTQFAKPERRSFEWVELKDTSYQEINFQNTAQDLKLAGMLFVPEGEGPFPAAVIIHGSGTSYRDSGWYLTLTQYLQKNGVLVLLPDKRGSEQSEGDWRTASFEDLATDTVEAVDFLNNQAEVAISDIGVIGLSQGGHIAPVVADQTQDIAFLVNIVGATDLGRVIHANSITLTPGTVSIELEGNEIIVHALNEAFAEDLFTGVMDRRVTAIEPR